MDGVACVWGRVQDAQFQDNIGLIYHVMKRYLGRGYDAEDLFQIGSIGLMKAIWKFDTSYEVCFSTYAVPLIAGEIRRFLRDDGMIKVSRSVKENQWKIQRAREELEQKYARDCTMQELADATGLSMEDVSVALSTNQEVQSFDQPLYQSDGKEITMLDQISENKQDSGEDTRIVNKVLIEELRKSLSEEENTLIELRFFSNHTQTEIAKEMGLTQVQVCRLEKKILLEMRKKIG